MILTKIKQNQITCNKKHVLYMTAHVQAGADPDTLKRRSDSRVPKNKGGGAEALQIKMTYI